MPNILVDLSFNPRPHVAGDRVSYVANPAQEFQSTPARGGRQGLGGFAKGYDLFQSTPARGGRLSPGMPPAARAVSIHARTWRATLNAGDPIIQCKFQSTPARGGRPACACLRRYTVSIHARTWRATGSRAKCSGSNISIHARTWRATSDVPTGCVASPVSIHARTWRATRGRSGMACYRVSIHARTWRATRLEGKSFVSDLFQSTPARGGRRFNT